MKIFIDFFESF